MLEVLAAIILVLVVFFTRRYRELRRVNLVDAVNVRRHGKQHGIVAKRARPGLGRIASFVLAFGFLMPRSGFTLNGQAAGSDIIRINTTTGAGSTTSIVDANGLTDAGASYYRGAVVYILSGAAKGSTATVTGSAVGSLTIAPALPAAAGSGAQYLLVADPSGLVYNLTQQVLDAVKQIGSIVAVQSGTTPIDKAGGVQYVAVSFVDRSASPPAKVASGSIDISTATMVIYKSTGDGNFSSAGITPQPTPAKATGLIESQDGAGNKGFAITAAQWATGDTGLITLSGVKVTDSNGNIEPIGDVSWTFQIQATLTVDTNVSAIKTDIENAIAAPTADSLRDQLFVGAGAPLRSFIAKGTGSAVAANKSLADAIGNTGDAPIPPVNNALAAGASSLQATLGRKDDAAASAVSATQTLMAYAKAVGGTGDPASATGSVNAKLALLIAELAPVRSIVTAGSTTSVIADTAFPGTGSQFNGMLLLFTAGTNTGQARIIQSQIQNVSVTVTRPFSNAPNAGDAYCILPMEFGAPTADSTETASINGAIGNKADAAPAAGSALNATSSLMKYLKGVFTAVFLGPAAADNATAAGTANVFDTIGRKDDTAPAGGTALTSTSPIMRYVKALYNAVFLGPAAADNAVAAGTATLFESTGRKDDAAATAVNTTQTQFAYLKGLFKNLGVWTKDNYATIVCPTAAETDVVAQVAITRPTHVIAKLDLSNLTVNATVKVYHAMGAAGATLTAENSRAFTFATDAKIVPIDFWTDGDYKITVTTGAEGANRNVLVRHSRMVSQ